MTLFTRMTTLLFLFVFTVKAGYSQDIENSTWRINRVIGIDTNNTTGFTLERLDTTNVKSWGNYLKIDSVGNFRCWYTAPCGNDCFPSSSGNFSFVDSARTSIYLYQIAQEGDCDHFNKMLNQALGTYRIVKKDTTCIQLIREVSSTVPEGFIEFARVSGDLNGDSIADSVIVVKGTDTSRLVVNHFDEKVDRNRRGILIFLSDGKAHRLTCKNINCFSSDQEDGGVYFAPELHVEIHDSLLVMEYTHGRYGSWSFTFEKIGIDFILTHYFSSEDRGPIILRQTSIDFTTGTKIVSENINEDGESGEEVFEKTSSLIYPRKIYKLSEIQDFDKLANSWE